ncbi:unnamed protein product, partial [Closterium sp. NIES-64]
SHGSRRQPADWHLRGTGLALLPLQPAIAAYTWLGGIHGKLVRSARSLSSGESSKPDTHDLSFLRALEFPAWVTHLYNLQCLNVNGDEPRWQGLLSDDISHLTALTSLLIAAAAVGEATRQAGEVIRCAVILRKSLLV